MSSTNALLRFVQGFWEDHGENGKPMQDASDYFLAPASTSLGGQVAVGVVADSIAEIPRGDSASRIAVQTIEDSFLANPVSDPNRSIAAAIEAAHRAVLTRKSSNRSLAGIGSTATVAVMTGDRVFVGSVGDSRAYLVGPRGVKRLTKDHTWLQEARDAHRISEAEAKVHPNRNTVKRYLGMNGDFSCDISPTEHISPADSVLLCTDGLTDVLEENELTVVATESPSSASAKLVDRHCPNS